MQSESTYLRFPAIAFEQSGGRVLYAFVANGQHLSQCLTISRVRRNGHFEIEGYQRAELTAHIANIRSYLQSETPILPNALVVAFDRRVRFTPLNETATSSAAGRYGCLEVPVDVNAPASDRPGWIVDGQQRMAALREAQLEGFYICVVAFVAESDQEQREQFILVNSTKPLPKSLIYELLPSTDGHFTDQLNARRFPARLLARLNSDEDSPLQNRIKTITNPTGDIKDNSVLLMIEHSLADGVLYRYRNPRSGVHDIEAMLMTLKAFWSAVANVFPIAWERPPQRSRLTHGAGMISMGYLMDTIADRYRDVSPPSTKLFETDLLPLAPICRWTDGYWEFGPGTQRKWNEVQNTPLDVRMLTNYLLVQYRQLVWDRTLELRQTVARAI